MAHEILFVQTLLNEVNGHGEKKSTVENTARRLTELSRKEDCDVIHNLIMAVQDRYKKLQQRTSERGRMLEEVRKSAKQVCHDINSNLNLMCTLSLTCATQRNLCVISVFISHVSV